MDSFKDLLPYLTGIKTWIALAGLGVFGFLVLFRSLVEHVLTKLKIPARQAAGLVHVFMALVALIALVTLALAFLDARDERAAALLREQQEAYRRDLAAQQAALSQCLVSAETAAAFVKPFETTASVRCPGGGCSPFDGNCNHRSTLLSFAASGDYFIDSYRIVKGQMNDGNIGEAKVTSRDDSGRPTAIQATLWCDPSDRPGAGGGWANADFVGTLRLHNEAERRTQIAADCAARHPAPEPVALPGQG
jgi:hypothetical protein